MDIFIYLIDEYRRKFDKGIKQSNDGFIFEFCVINSDFLSHGKLLIESPVSQVYLYGFFSIAQKLLIL